MSLYKDDFPKKDDGDRHGTRPPDITDRRRSIQEMRERMFELEQQTLRRREGRR